MNTRGAVVPIPASASSRWLRPLGRTGLSVTAICLGAAEPGRTPGSLGDEAEVAAIELIRQALTCDIRFLDTSGGGAGRSEGLIARAVAPQGELLDNVVVATDVNADYSGRRVRTAVRDSLQRLGMKRLPLVFVRDPELHRFDLITALGGAVDTLVGLRDAGEIAAIGVAGGDTDRIGRYVDLGVFDAVKIHSRWTLIDRSAGPLFDRAVAAGMAVVNADVYGGGLLNGTGSNHSAGCRPAHPAAADVVLAMDQVCRWWGTDLATAALLFSLRDPRIASTVAGFADLSAMTQTLAALDDDMVEAFWDELDGLMPTPE